MKILAKPKYGPINPRNNILYKHLNDRGHIIRNFNYINCFKRHDIFHVHWPDLAVTKSMTFSIVRLIMLLIFLKMIKIRCKKIIWTVHNVFPKGNRNPILKKLFLGIMVSEVDGYICPSNTSFRIIKKISSKSEAEFNYVPLGLQYEVLEKGFTSPPELEGC